MDRGLESKIRSLFQKAIKNEQGKLQRLFKRIVAVTGLMARSVKDLLHRPEDLSSDLQKPHGKARHRSAPMFLALGRQRRGRIGKTSSSVSDPV